jgi:general transcription factor 3C polypeptide 3 (transcription factor C subunit 4)
MSNEHQFNNEPLRIILACLTPGLRGTDAFIEKNLSKWSLRLNRGWDQGAETRNAEQYEQPARDNEEEIERDVSAMDLDKEENPDVKNGKILRWSNVVCRWVPVSKTARGNGDVSDEQDQEAGEEAGLPLREPTRLPLVRSPITRLIQGAMLNASKSSHGALCRS